MNQLLSFYYGSYPDHRGRMLAEVVQQDDDWIEQAHDFIQWLFPLNDLSRASSHAPLVDGATNKASEYVAFKTPSAVQAPAGVK